MEFTKISPNKCWRRLGPANSHAGHYVEFPSRKNKRRSVKDYLDHAYPGAITSSIPPLLGKAQKSAEEARDAVRRQQRNFTRISIPSALVLIIALVALFVQVASLVNDSNSDRENLNRRVDSLTRELHELRASAEAQQKARLSSNGRGASG